MSRKLLFVSLLLISLLIAGTSYDNAALASTAAQEPNPPERIGPEQFSYHGRETMPHLASSLPPNPNSLAPLGTVDQWSKMTFESYVGGGWEIYSASGGFTDLLRLTNNGDVYDINPRLNRGATRIAFASDRYGYIYQVFTMNLDGSNVIQLTYDNADNARPAWSPDGTKIAFQSFRDGKSEVYVMNSDGSGQTRLTFLGDYNGEPTWSPDGSQIAFTSYRNSVWRIWVMDANGANQLQLSQQPYSELPAWSPDGSQIAYDADSDGDYMQELWVMKSNGSDQTIMYNGSSSTLAGYTAWANGWQPDNSYMTMTVVFLEKYGDYWYWSYSWLYKIAFPGFVYSINEYRYEDWNLDWTTTDIQPPTTSMSVPPSPQPYQFTVSWNGYDAKSGVADYDVQVRDGPSGTWTNWQQQTTAHSAVYTGVGGHTYYFRTRARDYSFNLQAWPANPQASVTVESAPPTTHIDTIEPLIRGDQVTLYWQGTDPRGSGISGYDIQYKDAALGVWQDLLANTTITSTVFTGEMGHTYSFRSRGTDYALNIESWPFGDGDTSTTFYAWLTSGTAHDNTGVPVEGMDLTVDPAAFLTHPSDDDGSFSAYLASNPAVKTITWVKAEYGPLPPTDFGIPDAVVDVYLPPADNAVVDSGFESGVLPGDWQAGGDFTPTITNTLYHSGDYAASLGVPQSLSAPIPFDSTYIQNWSIKADQWGNVHMAWILYSSGSYYVRYSMRTPDGAWSANEQLISFNAASTGGIEIVVDSHHNVHMLILAYPDVFYAMRDSSGNWSPLESILTTVSGTWFIGVEIDEASTIRGVIATADSLYYIEHADGGVWAIETVPNVIHKNGTAMAITQQGEIYIAWTSYNEEVYFTQRGTDGSWTNPTVFYRPGYARTISMVVDSHGNPYIVWDAIFPGGMYYTTRDRNGSWLEPLDISGGLGGFEFRLLIDKSDTVYGLWTENYYTYDIFFSQIDENGNWSAGENISTSVTSSGYVEAAVSGDGDIYATWWDYDNGYLIYYASRHAGVWSTPVRLGNQTSDTYFAKVITDPFGGGHIAWRDGNPFMLYYAGTRSNLQSGISRLSQSLIVPASMNNPTLSFLASLSGVSTISGNQFQVLVTDPISTTTLFSSTTPATWEHFWFDISPWSGEQITLTFQVSEHAGFPPAHALLDEVTLGAAHSDAWIALSDSVPFAPPGEQFTFQLAYGNRSAIAVVSSAITLTLPTGLNFIAASLPPTSIVGSQVTWQVGDLPAGSTGEPILVSVQVDASAPFFQVITTTVDIATASPEIEVLNNTAHFDTLVGYVQLVPVLLK